MLLRTSQRCTEIAEASFIAAKEEADIRPLFSVMFAEVLNRRYLSRAKSLPCAS